MSIYHNEIKCEGHCLYGCESVMNFWAESSFWKVWEMAAFLDFPSSLQAAKEMLSPLNFELFTVSGWTAWFERNRVVMGDPNLHGFSVVGSLDFQWALNY